MRQLRLTFANYEMEGQEHKSMCHGHPLHVSLISHALAWLSQLTSYHDKNQKFRNPVHDVRLTHIRQHKVSPSDQGSVHRPDDQSVDNRVSTGTHTHADKMKKHGECERSTSLCIPVRLLCR